MGTPILHEATLESGKTETYRPPLASQGSSISTGIPQGHEPNTADSIISLSDQTNQTLPSPGARITFDGELVTEKYKDVCEHCALAPSVPS